MESISACDLDRRLADLVRSERHLVVQFVVEAGRLCQAGALSRAWIHFALLLLHSPTRALEVVRLQAIGSGSSHLTVPCHLGSAGRRATIAPRPGRAAGGAGRAAPSPRARPRRAPTAKGSP